MKNTQMIKSQLAEKTIDFCRAYLDKEYEDICLRVLDKMARKRAVPFIMGRTEIWAAAIIHSVGSINFLFDKSFKPFISYDQISEYFNVPKSTISQKSRKIREMLKMQQWSSEFSTKRMEESNPFKNLTVINIDGMPFIVPTSSLDRLETT